MIFVIAAIWLYVLVLIAGDELLHALVSDETIERWTDRIFR